MILAALLALALDQGNLPSPDLALELKLRERAGPAENPVAELALVNRSRERVHRVVTPGDGSACGWREPYVFWSAEAPGPDGAWTALQPRPYSRCGNYAANWEKDVVELKPGERIVLWMREAQQVFDFTAKGRIRLVAHYRYRAHRGLFDAETARRRPCRTAP